MGSREQKARVGLAKKGNLIETFPFEIASKTRRTIITTSIQGYVGSPSQQGNKQNAKDWKGRKMTILKVTFTSF